jgi:transmembrane sensor
MPNSNGIQLRNRRRLAMGLAAMLLIGVSAVLSLRMSSSQTYRTEIGAVTATPLSDGSQVTLNTDTQIQVRMTEAERHVQLAQGGNISALPRIRRVVSS